ncbi:MAG: TetR/AcrR family transcriptional regulator [Myxococcota bacterium]
MAALPTAPSRLIAAVGPCLVEADIEVLTVQVLLDRAGVSRRTFYKYFDGLPELLLAAYEQVCDQVEREIITAVIDAKGLRAKAQAAVDTWIDVMTRPGSSFLPLHSMAAQPQGPMHARFELFVTRGVELMNLAVHSRTGVVADPYIYRIVVVGADALLRHVARQGPITEPERARIHLAVRAMHLGMFTVSSGGGPAPSNPH